MNDLNNEVMAPLSISLKYKGGVTTEVVDSLLTLVLHRLEDIEVNVNVRKKVYSVLMECSQNICLHTDNGSDNGTLNNSVGYLSIESDGVSYQITSSNFIKNEKLKTLLLTLENINQQKTPDDLKKLYNQIMTNNKYSLKGGGGLGLIDVARKSNGKLDYSFTSLNDEYSFFTLNVTIKKY